MYRIRNRRCVCCELEHDIAVDADSPFQPSICSRCYLHQGDEVLCQRDHAAMYRRALDDAQDATELAHGERDFYRQRAARSARSGEALVRVLSRIESLHHDRGGRCCCGEAGCTVQELLADPAVARLIGTYDEEQHTLYELRRANPGAFAQEWDYVDVTLVYPPRARRPVGRHRAAG